MEQIRDVVTELDVNPHGRATVHVFRLENAEPQEVSAVLQDIFQTTTTQNSRSQQQNQNNPLSSRTTTQGTSTSQQSGSTTRGMGTTTGSRGSTGFGIGP